MSMESVIAMKDGWVPCVSILVVLEHSVDIVLKTVAAQVMPVTVTPGVGTVSVDQAGQDSNARYLVLQGLLVLNVSSSVTAKT